MQNLFLKVLYKCKSNFENIFILVYFNMEPTNRVMPTFMADNDFINIINSITCFKTSTGILKNKPKKFSEYRSTPCPSGWLPRSINLLKLPPRSQIMPPRPINE